MVITDRVQTQNGADFTFVCGKIPFAVSCSSDLPHRNFNVIDLDLINKMKIPLKNIRVTRISIQGHDLRCVGIVSQTIQCVVDGKVSGTIHLYAKVVRDLFNSISADCIASRRTYSRLMGEDPPAEPPDDPSIEVLGGDDEEDDEDAEDATSSQESNAKEDDVLVSNAEGDDVLVSNAKGDDVPVSNAEGNDVLVSNSQGDDVTSTTEEIPIDYSRCFSTTRYDEKSLYPDEDYYDSDGNFDPVLTDYVNNPDDYPDDAYYQGGQIHRVTKRRSRTRVSPKLQSKDKHCQYCFLNGESIKVTSSHNVLDIDCPSMSDDDRRRIHGDKETDKWLARLYGYYD